MSPISQRFAVPTNDDAFEEMCLRLLRHHWSRPGLEIFGKRGERQHGIDILDVGGETPVFAAQCKLKEEHKSLTPGEIQHEVNEAKGFIPPLGKYALLTTGKVSTRAQRKVREINQSHKEARLFEVELLTWEHLCSLLQQYPDVQEFFYGEITASRASKIDAQLVSISNGVQSLASRTEGDDIDSLINEARDYIVRKEFQYATFLLNRVLIIKGDKLTSRQRFRVLSNLGAASLGKGKPEAAAKYFLEAVSHQPDDEQGRINESLAYLLVGDVNSCFAKAATLRRQYPASSRLAALWLASAPRETQLSSLELEVDPVLKADTEVCVALARRALAELSFDKARDYADSANKAAPKWSQPQLILAQISLGRVINAHFGFRASDESKGTTLLEAEAACSKTVDMAREEKDEQTEKMALVLRVDIRLMLNKLDEAIKDAEDAERLDAEDTQIMIAVAQTCFASGRVEDGMSVLKRAHRLRPDPNIGFIYGRALYNRGRDGDLDEAISVLLQVSIDDIRPEVRPTFATQVFQCLAKKKDWSQAEKYLSAVSEFLDNVVVKTIRGYLAHYQGLSREAERHALEARSLISPNVNPDTKDYLAHLLMLLGKPADALPLWQDLFNKKAPTFDPRNLLNCASRLHRDDLVMQICDQIHAMGMDDWHFLEFEVAYLEKYKIDVAVSRLQDFVKQHPEHKLARLRLSMIGLRLNKADLVCGELQDVPSIDDLPLDYAVPAVQVMKYGGNPNAALDYAYKLLRANFYEIQAHQALIVSMLPGSSEPDIPHVLDVVELNAAVCYRELPRGGDTWVVLEDTDRPSRDFEEISLKSPLAGELLGKRTGEVVVIAKGSVQNRSATIVQILPKYVRRYQDSMGEMQLRFGEASSVESIRLEQGAADGSGQQGVEVILASVERRAASVAEIRQGYNTLPASLHSYGACFGKNAYLALIDLAVKDRQEVKCCIGSPEERDQGLKALQTAKAVVVDMSALATLRLLGMEKVLASTKFRFLISERTWIAFQEMRFDARVHSAPGGMLVFKDGKHMIYQETTEEKAQHSQKDVEFVQFIERVTEIRSAPGLAAIEPEKRQALEKFFGSYGAESIVLASSPDYVLWTDDLIQAQLSAHEFGTRRVWTQLVLGTLTDSGLLNPGEYREASAKLIGMEFVVTLFDCLTMCTAFALAQWAVERSPAAQVLRIFSNPAADLQSLMRIYVEFIIRLYREPVTPEIRCSVTQVFLDTLAVRPGSMPLLLSLRKMSDRLFGINEVGRLQFERCFDSWLKGRDGPLIQTP